VDGPFLVAGGDASEAFQSVDQPFHQVPLMVRRPVEPYAPFSLLARDDGSDAAPPQISPDLLAAIALVPSDPIRTDPWPSSTCPPNRTRLHQSLERGLLMPLSCCDQEGKRLAPTLGPQVDRGGEAPSAAAQRFIRMLPCLLVLSLFLCKEAQPVEDAALGIRRGQGPGQFQPVIENATGLFPLLLSGEHHPLDPQAIDQPEAFLLLGGKRGRLSCQSRSRR
jgi:hypothetical protein